MKYLLIILIIACLIGCENNSEPEYMLDLSGNWANEKIIKEVTNYELFTFKLTNDSLFWFTFMDYHGAKVSSTTESPFKMKILETKYNFIKASTEAIFINKMNGTFTGTDTLDFIVQITQIQTDKISIEYIPGKHTNGVKEPFLIARKDNAIRVD